MEFSNYERKQGQMAFRQLSPRAQAACNGLDIDLYKKDELYYVCGMVNGEEMTFEELDQFLSEVADALKL